MKKDFKIILPGPCNAHCDFCFWKHKEAPKDYLAILDKTLANATSEFTQLNISGGEPTISPYFKDAMEIIAKYRHKFTKVVLTTNGSNLSNVLNDIKGVVDHLNISRHHHTSRYNMDIFKSTEVPDDEELSVICHRANDRGIDVTINALVNDKWNYIDLLSFVELTKRVGASYLVFRHDCSKGLHTSNFETWASSKIVHTYSCDVCKTNVRIINGVFVSWKYSVMEPSDIIRDDIFEIILGQDGALSLDYAGTKTFEFREEAKPDFLQNLELISSTKDSREYSLNGNKVLFIREETLGRNDDSYPVGIFTLVSLSYDNDKYRHAVRIKGNDYETFLLGVQALFSWLEEKLLITIPNVDVVAKIENPCIAVIVSDRIDHCIDFLKYNNLNPKFFKLVADVPKLRSIRKDTPVIITHHGNSSRFCELMAVVHHRFTNVRYINY